MFLYLARTDTRQEQVARLKTYLLRARHIDKSLLPVDANPLWPAL